LRHYAELKSVDLFPDNPAEVRLNDASTYEVLQQLEDELLALKPANARNQWWLGQATTLAGKIGDARWLLAQQVGQGTPKEIVALLVFWLVLLFASFGLFAPHNFVSAATLTLCAIAVAGAIGMVLELEKGFGGVIHVSPQPMRQAVAQLQFSDRMDPHLPTDKLNYGEDEAIPVIHAGVFTLCSRKSRASGRAKTAAGDAS
jgi:hypothetical protein